MSWFACRGQGERHRVSFLLHLYVGSVDEIQGTDLCSLVYLFICCLRQSLMKLAISATLSGQQHWELPVLGL